MLIEVHELKKIINAQVQAALWECCHPNFANDVSDDAKYSLLIDQIFEDAAAYCKKDPASRNCIASILQTYTSFKAILHYRIAHFIHKHSNSIDKEHYALFISNRGKILSGAELHYKCEIGKNFVLDHGYGTVIGETSVIGSDCYILGGVVLGATGIANNAIGRRHPKVGNNVEIGAFSRIFGDVEIGNNVFIGPNCVVLEDVPTGYRIITKTSNQIMRSIM
ncbi:serine acetyltransferase [Acinetobacter shaoyimingii]|uniref:serine O-acetyltransferase n=1 Tax=Acinetobacter shaoyimingii TaxID=2715164 RepID=A0A6G8RYG7_9GAMM|nr:serine acetyltransferase [Acinetobacter shaoyimingii]NHB58023.1 serine acetyltransferase [Acinetobacter shaoyimingii]QIO06979.1 serine acetyltransferase [Acinetobacter shaoyimingii]